MSGLSIRVHEAVGVEHFSEWLWARARHRFRPAFALVFFVLYDAFMILPISFVIPLYFDMGLSEAPGYFLVGSVAVAAVAMLSVFFGLSDDWSVIDRWARGNRDDPVGTLETSLRLVRRLGVRAAVLAFPVGCLTLVPYWIWRADLSPAGAPVFAASISMAAVIGTLVIGSALDLLLRPLREEASAAMPGGATLPPTARGASLALRSTLIGCAFAGIVGFTSSAVVLQFDTGESRFNASVVGGVVLLVVNGYVYLYSVAFVPALRPVSDLTAAARRVSAGDYAVPLPVTSDDDIGELIGAFNDMQNGLAQRERLRSAFGSYVDPMLAARLLDQHDELFSGERVDVTVMFVDIRDFTPFAESHTAEETVAHLNALFELIVPVVAEYGGHTNKFLGDGAMMVFGVPRRLDDHADRAVAAARRIEAVVDERFGGRTRIGIGINSGTAIAGTIGGGGKLEFTLIGDVVNVAARVEQLTKETADTVLVTEETVHALLGGAPALSPRGQFAVKGKARPVTVHGLDPSAVGERPEPV